MSGNYMNVDGFLGGYGGYGGQMGNGMMSHQVPMVEASMPQASTPVSSPPIKRKRGRPPKATSLTSQITTRLNIDINTSPLTSSPTAESNSNMIVKQGAPDCFTPLMRVSPTSRRKKRKNSQTMYTPGGLKKPRSKSALATPLSSAINGSTFTPYQQINSKTLDNISLITQSEPRAYNTPPGSSIKQVYSQSADSADLSLDSQTRDFSSSSESLLDSYVMAQKQANAKTDYKALNNSSLLPPVSIVSTNNDNNRERKQLEPKSALSSNSFSDRPDGKENNPHDFSLRLMIDDSGKAVLSSEMFNNAQVGKTVTFSEEPSIATVERPENENKSYNLDKPKLTHANTVIGIESQYMASSNYNMQQSNYDESAGANQMQNSRHNSDTYLSGVSNNGHADNMPEGMPISNNEEKYPRPPQTPKYKDNYLFTSTGLTPSNALSYNLTPQFNSLMSSMMNINSPQQRKAINSQFLANQDLFLNYNSFNQNASYPGQATNQLNTVNMNDLMSMGGNSLQKLGKTPDMNPQASRLPLASEAPASSEDTGDARSALKKIMHVKRS